MTGTSATVGGAFQSSLKSQMSQDFRATIEATAQAILDARARYPDSSLADLYDPLTMPADLRAAPPSGSFVRSVRKL